MPSQKRFAASVVELVTSGWQNPSNAEGDTPGTFSHYVLSSGGSSELIASDFGFSLPGNAVVQGSELAFLVSQDPDPQGPFDLGLTAAFAIRLQDGDGAIGGEFAEQDTAGLSTTPRVDLFGSPTDKAGADLPVSLVNSSAFGASYSAQGQSIFDTIDIRLHTVSLEIFFTLPEGAKSLSALRLGGGP